MCVWRAGVPSFQFSVTVLKRSAAVPTADPARGNADQACGNAVSNAKCDRARSRPRPRSSRAALPRGRVGELLRYQCGCGTVQSISINDLLIVRWSRDNALDVVLICSALKRPERRIEPLSVMGGCDRAARRACVRAQDATSEERRVLSIREHRARGLPQGANNDYSEREPMTWPFGNRTQSPFAAVARESTSRVRSTTVVRPRLITTGTVTRPKCATRAITVYRPTGKSTVTGSRQDERLSLRAASTDH